MTRLDTRDPAPPLAAPSAAADPAVSWKAQCLNCAAPLSGAFCANCGQRAVPPHPTLSQLAGDAFSELSGWDGKFADTVRTLFRRPGELTRAWVEGRRVHYISPFRLYLTASLLYFVTVAAAPSIGPAKSGTIDVGGLQVGAGTHAAGQVASETQNAVRTVQPLTGAERDSAMAKIANAPEIMRPLFLKAIDEPAAFKSAMMHAMSNVFMVLVPVFAGLLALFYRRRHYPEHLYFTIHIFAFFFIARAIGNLALFTRSLPIAAAVQVVMMLWLIGYYVKATRRVYGGSVLGTIARGFIVCFLYAVIAAPVILGTALLVVR